MIALSESERVETLRVLLENKCAAAAARRRCSPPSPSRLVASCAPNPQG
jgi:hypothetical protein